MIHYTKRLLNERCELYKKIMKLKWWLQGRVGLSLHEEQLKVMEQYLEILDKRIGEV